MMYLRSMVTVFILGCVLLAAPFAAWAGSGSAKIIPHGSLGLLDGDAEVQTIRSEIPAPNDQLFMCHGKCLIQTQGLQFVAHDEAVLAVSDTQEGIDLNVQKGRVDFAITPNAKAISIATAHDVIQIQETVFSASTQSSVTGIVVAKDTGSSLGVSQGALRVLANGQPYYVQSGKTLQLAQADIGGSGGGEAAGAGGATTTGVTAGTVGTVIAGGTIAGIAIAAAAQDDNDEPTSPF